MKEESSMAVRRRNKISFPVMLLVAVGVAFILIRFASLQMQLGREENELAQKDRRGAISFFKFKIL